jgi:hypothetical protein
MSVLYTSHLILDLVAQDFVYGMPFKSMRALVSRRRKSEKSRIRDQSHPIIIVLIREKRHLSSSCFVVSLVLSCRRVLSCLVLSCVFGLVLYCIVYPVIPCELSCLVLSCPVLLCLVLALLCCDLMACFVVMSCLV